MNHINSSVSVIIYGGIFVYSLLIITLMLSNRITNIYIYIEVEVNKYIKNSSNVYLYWILRNISTIIIITTIAHIIIKMGVYNSILYNINYWLIGTGLGLYIIPFIVYGYRLFIYIINYSIYQLSINNKYNNLNSYNYLTQVFNGTNYNNSYMISIMDISSIMNLYRGINNIMNWLYQMIYYGVRLWLVFVLHSFSLGCFGELITIITDNNLFFNFFYFGLLGIGIFLFLLVVFYLSIQIYVYISFSLSFLHSTILLLFYEPIYPSSLNIHSNSSFLSSINIVNKYLLIPVSLVDLISLNTIFYLFFLYLLLLIFIPILLSSSSSSSYLFSFLRQHLLAFQALTPLRGFFLIFSMVVLSGLRYVLTLLSLLSGKGSLPFTLILFLEVTPLGLCREGLIPSLFGRGVITPLLYSSGPLALYRVVSLPSSGVLMYPFPPYLLWYGVL